MSLFFVLALALLLQLCSSQDLDARTLGLKVMATATDVPRPTITIQWPLEQCTSSYPCDAFSLRRRVYDRSARNASVPADLAYDTGLFPIISWFNSQTYLYVDTNVTVGTIYEYKLERWNQIGTNPPLAYTFFLSGIKVPLQDYNGVVILVVESSIATTLATQFQTLQNDLVGDGWGVNTVTVGRNETVPQVKAKIVAAYQQNPTETKAVYLFGRVPVPYSGFVMPDGRSEHWGAWPADIYYGDVVDDGTTWTDVADDYSNPDNLRTRNVPGDGKYDQRQIDTDIELYVGRVDLSQFTRENETTLLARYVTKNHNFRHAITKFPRRAIVSEGDGDFYPETPAGNGYRTLNALFNSSNVITNSASNVMASSSEYLLFYGCGAGTYVSMNGTGSTNDYYTNSPKFGFTLQYGEYFGDWDVADNFLRAPLAYGSALTDVWSINDLYQYHYLGMGLSFGRATWENQNAKGSTWMALMGDPTLRLFVVDPPSNVAAVAAQNTVRITWTASTDSTVLGYHVYRAVGSIRNRFSRISTDLVTGASFVDNSPSADYTVYMVKAVKLEMSTTGTYYSPSQGIFASVGQEPSPTPTSTTASTSSPSSSSSASSTTSSPSSSSPSSTSGPIRSTATSVSISILSIVVVIVSLL